MEQIAFIQETDQGEPDKREGEGEHRNISRNGTLRLALRKVRDFSFYYA
jgi:hypothetical protein